MLWVLMHKPHPHVCVRVRERARERGRERERESLLVRDLENLLSFSLSLSHTHTLSLCPCSHSLSLLSLFPLSPFLLFTKKNCEKQEGRERDMCATLSIAFLVCHFFFLVWSGVIRCD
jgi:hypothetical protein